VILGVIATFTIPKVLSSQQDAQFKSIGKETAAMLSGTHQALKLQGSLSANTTKHDFTPYLNYVRVISVGQVDARQTNANHDCSSRTCLLLHNGGVFHYGTGSDYFGGTESTNAVAFNLDPDGKVTDGGTGDTSPTAPGKSVELYIYIDGKVRTRGTIEPNTCDFSNCSNPQSVFDPPWFSWN